MRLLAAFACILLLCGCAAAPTEPAVSTPVAATFPPETTAPPPTTQPKDPIEELLGDMTVQEQVGQLFLVRCYDSAAIADIQNYHLGGLVLFSADFENQTPESVQKKIAGYQAAADVPLLIAVDEEGGTVNRISRYPAFRRNAFPSPRSSYAEGGLEQVLAIEEEKAQLLSSLGINVSLGPVCDITTEKSAFMYRRSLGLDAQTTGDVICQMAAVMESHGVGTVLKHFPGYGNNADTHTGIARDSRSLEALEGCDLIPFARGFDAGCNAVLVSHTIVEALDPDLPASLSPAVHWYLRQTMGFDGVIITDDLVMQAITDTYGAGEAAVLAVLAGNDLLCCTDYAVQYQAVLDAVLTGRIDFFTLNDAARRVLQWKQSLGLLQ